jgi:hypothetical protein
MSSPPGKSVPEQAWAHKYSRIDLGPHRRIDAASVATRLEIQDLFSRWGVAHDEGRTDVIGSLFTLDGQIEVVEGPATRAKFQGRDTIIAEIGRVFNFQADQRRHCVTNVLIDNLTSLSADCIAYCVCTVNGLDMAASVIYSAKVRLDGDTWRFGHLMIGLDSYAGKRPEEAIPGKTGTS